MKATVQFTTTLRVWRDYGAVHIQMTLSLAGLALDGIQADIRGGAVSGLAVVSGDLLDGPALAELLTERCRLDEVQVIVHEPPLSNSPHAVGREPVATGELPVVGRGTRGKRKAIRE